MLKGSKVKFLVFFLPVILIYSLAFSLLYNYFILAKVDEFDKRFKNIYGQLTVELPKRGSYLIKIWGISYPQKVYFNNVEVSPFSLRERGILKEQYIRVDVTPPNKSLNTLNIISEVSQSVRIKNFYGATESKTIYVVFKSSTFQGFDFAGFMRVTVLAFLILIGTWVIFYFICGFIFNNFRFRVFFIGYCLYNLGLLLPTAILVFIFSLTDYRVIISKECFLTWAVFLYLSLNLFIFIGFILKYRSIITFESKAARLVVRIARMPNDELKSHLLDFYLGELECDFKKAPARLFIIIFILLCLACMVLLVFRLDSIANWVSYLAYFCLAAGIISMFKEFIKEENK